MFQDEPVGLSGTGFNTESTASDLIKLQAAGEGGGFIPGLNHYLAHVFFPQGQRTVEEYKKPLNSESYMLGSPVTTVPL